MEITCNRCHQTVQAENCYCSSCGLPQLVYATDGAQAQAQPERWDEAVRDASSIDWKPALSAALKLAIPAGVLCAMLSRSASLDCSGWLPPPPGRDALSAQPAPRVDHHRSRRAHRAGHWLAGRMAGLLRQRQRCSLSSGLSSTNPARSTPLTTAFCRQVPADGSAIAGRWVRPTPRSCRLFAKMQALMLSPEGHAGFAAFPCSRLLFLLHFCRRRRRAGSADAGPLAPAGTLTRHDADFVLFSTTCPQAQTLLSCIR